MSLPFYVLGDGFLSDGLKAGVNSVEVLDEGIHGIVETKGDQHILAADDSHSQSLGETAHPTVIGNKRLHSIGKCINFTGVNHSHSRSGEIVKEYYSKIAKDN